MRENRNKCCIDWIGVHKPNKSYLNILKAVWGPLRQAIHRTILHDLQSLDCMLGAMHNTRCVLGEFSGYEIKEEVF